MTIYNEIMEIMKSVVANNSSLSLVEDSPGFSIIGIASSREMNKIRKDLNQSLKNRIEQCCDEKIREELEQKKVIRRLLAREDGQSMWRALSYKGIEANDNILTFTKDLYVSEADFIKNELVNTGLLENCATFDETQDIMTKFRELWKTIQSLEHDEVLVLDSKSWTFEKKERHEVSFQEDFYIYAFVFSII